MDELKKLPAAKTLDELKDNFSDWWLGGAVESRFARFKVAAMMASSGFGERKDLDTLMDLIELHCQHLGWCSEWLPDAEGFLQAALGLATEEAVLGMIARSERAKFKPSATQEKLIVEGKVMEVQRCVRAIERLGATLNHRIDALRTIVSTERERWKNETGSSNQGGNRGANTRG